MLGRLLKWWRGRKVLKNRMLYPYWDGTKRRYGDPFKIWRELKNNGIVDLDAVAPLVDAGQEPETTKSVEAIAAAFQVRRWNEATKSGLTDWEVLALYWEMASFIEALKKNISPGPTLPEPTDLQSSTSQEHQPETTNASSDCGSAETEQTQGEQTSPEEG